MVTTKKNSVAAAATTNRRHLHTNNIIIRARYFARSHLSNGDEIYLGRNRNERAFEHHHRPHPLIRSLLWWAKIKRIKPHLLHIMPTFPIAGLNEIKKWRKKNRENTGKGEMKSALEYLNRNASNGTNTTFAKWMATQQIHIFLLEWKTNVKYAFLSS